MTGYSWWGAPWAGSPHRTPRSDAIRRRREIAAAVRVVLSGDPDAGARPEGGAEPRRRRPREFWSGYLRAYLDAGGRVFVCPEEAEALTRLLGPTPQETGDP